MGNGFIGWFERSYKGIIVALVAIMAIMLVVLAMQHVNSSRPAAGAEPGPIPTFGTPSETAAPIDVTLPAAGSKVLIIGDSWTAGYAADPAKGYATLLSNAFQWEPTIEGHSGSGYTRDGGSGTIPDVVTAFDGDADTQLILLDSGRNDTYVDHPQERQLATKTVDALQEKYPNAQIVMVGPAPLASDRSGFFDVDRTLQAVAATERVAYISAYQGNWFTTENVDTYIDHTKQDHPNNAGHAFYAEKLEQALRAL